MSFLDHRKNVFSQFGEDGIIESLFGIIRERNNICCEFGAWDGVHLSNCRNLILKGWKALMIEGDPEKARELEATYKDNQNVHCVARFVDDDENRLSEIYGEFFSDEMDFLSVDIDGLDYEILLGLDIYPKVICIEVGGPHHPLNLNPIPRQTASRNVGQSLGYFTQIALDKGYSLICYSSNAFYVRNDIISKYRIETISPEVAYQQYLETRSNSDREWLYLMNMGIVNPFYQFRNPLLNRKELGIGLKRSIYLKFKHKKSALPRFLRKAVVALLRTSSPF